MSNNLIVSYDLHEPGKNYENVTAAIKGLSPVWAKVQYSLWYVKAGLSAKEAAQQVWQAMDSNDSLIVIDATNNSSHWYNLTPEVSQHLQNNWALRRAA